MLRMLLGPSTLFILAVVVGFSPQDQEKPHKEWHFSPQEDSVRFARMNAEISEKIEDVKKSIAGQEDKPAPEVFKNLQMFKQLKAGQVTGIMETWSRSLGTSCQHCHVVDQWAKDDKPEKQVARDMLHMVGEINTNLLANIKNLDSKNPRIACWTCHEGRIKPPRPPWAREFQRKD
jgi:Photosynthetic reaction centre cytochrome C subunit.